ncbi:hypothetical protein [uncultured Bacteroides sp.]|uniref:hypothetical protein n=1 Tax=uncultured Bacteroides sp. TaxID=162156 RepID=UPI00260623C1|nr:hypothetical protein [uncultured Bacteroides sp.]
MNFVNLFSDLKALNQDTKYWMVRTMSGSYYGDFLRNGYIAVGYNDISLDVINSLPANENLAKEQLKEKIKKIRVELRNIAYPTSQLLRFTRDIKRGDIVIIPSSGATHVAIGTVESDVYEDTNPNIDSEHKCGFFKRRKINWKLSCRRGKLPPSLQLMFNSRHILSDVTSYAPYVDSVINDFYVKDDTMHMVLNIRTKDEVTFDDFFDLKAIDYLVDGFCRLYPQYGEGISPDDRIVMKVQMESPGALRLSSKTNQRLFFFGLFILFINGGGLEYSTKEGTKFKLSTDGLINAVSDYLDRKADRELLNSAARAVDSLKIEAPSDMQPVLELMKTKNEGRDKY